MANDIAIPWTEGTGGVGFYEFKPGMYEAIISEIEEVVNTFEETAEGEEPKMQLQFTFEIPGYANEDGSVASKRGWANKVWNPKTKLYQWATSILGDMPQGQGFRTSMLVGQPCRIILNRGQNKAGESILKLTDVLGAAEAGAPAGSAPKSAVKKAGLVAAIKGGSADLPDAVGLICGFPNCGRPAFSVDDEDGTPICPKHGGLTE